jgi:hypothetical protein
VSVVGDSGRDSGHGKIDAIDPNRTPRVPAGSRWWLNSIHSP